MALPRIPVTMFAGGGVKSTSGGVGTLILYLMEAWSSRSDGPRVRVIDTRGQGGKFGALVSFTGAIVSLVALRTVNRLGVMHVHMNAAGSTVRKGILCLLGASLATPVIVHLHGADFQEFYTRLPRSFQKIIRFVLNRTQSVIVMGDGWREFLINRIGVRPEKITIVLNGVKPPETSATVPTLGGTSGQPVRLLFLGRLGERKGVPELLAALQTPRLRARSWSATIAGDGLVNDYRVAAREMGLQDRISLPGWIDRAAADALLAEADILVLPSHHEVMPIAILEALANRIAVVATPVGTIPEFLADGENALLVEPGAPEQLADALVRLIDDPEERARLADAGHQLFRDRLDIGVIAERILALYESAQRGDDAPFRGVPADRPASHNANRGSVRMSSGG